MKIPLGRGLLAWTWSSFSSTAPMDWTFPDLFWSLAPSLWGLGQTKSIQSCLTLCDIAAGLQPARLLCPWDSPGKKYWSGSLCPSSGDPLDPGIKPTSPAWAGRFFWRGVLVTQLSSGPWEQPSLGCFHLSQRLGFLMWPSCCWQGHLPFGTKSTMTPGCLKPSVINALILHKIFFCIIPYPLRLHIRSHKQEFSARGSKHAEATSGLAVPSLSHKCPERIGHRFLTSSEDLSRGTWESLANWKWSNRRWQEWSLTF